MRNTFFKVNGCGTWYNHFYLLPQRVSSNKGIHKYFSFYLVNGSCWAYKGNKLPFSEVRFQWGTKLLTLKKLPEINFIDWWLSLAIIFLFFFNSRSNEPVRILISNTWIGFTKNEHKRLLYFLNYFFFFF